MCFDPYNRVLSFWESRRALKSHFQECEWRPHTSLKAGLQHLQHLVHLEELFKRLHEVNMKIHPKKYEFAITLVIYLGHRILPNGIMVHWAKVVAILEMPNPTDVHTLRKNHRIM